MKFDIVGRPELEFQIEWPLLEAFLTCASAHYDGACKRAADPGGFMFGWFNRVQFYLVGVPGNVDPEAVVTDDPPAPELPVLRGTFSEMDLLMKITENMGVLNNAQRMDVRAFRTDLHRALVQAQLVNWKWRLTVESR